MFLLCGIAGDASQPGGAWKRRNAHRPHVHHRLSCYLFDLFSLFFVDLMYRTCLFFFVRCEQPPVGFVSVPTVLSLHFSPSFFFFSFYGIADFR